MSEKIVVRVEYRDGEVVFHNPTTEVVYATVDFQKIVDEWFLGEQGEETWEEIKQNITDERLEVELTEDSLGAKGHARIVPDEELSSK